MHDLRSLRGVAAARPDHSTSQLLLSLPAQPRIESESSSSAILSSSLSLSSVFKLNGSSIGTERRINIKLRGKFPFHDSQNPR